MKVDEILSKFNLKYEDLEDFEIKSLTDRLEQLNTVQLSVPMVRDYVSKMRESTSHSLLDIQETPNSWVSLLGLFFPLVGIIRKWYLDQKRVYLTARLRNYLLLEAYLSGPDKLQQNIERVLKGIKN